MKKLCFYVMMILASALVLAVMPVDGEEGIYDSVIRLHVVAASDTAEDQALKLSVRDRLLTEYSARLGDAADFGEAEARVVSLCEEMTKTAKGVVEDAGYAYDVKVTYGKEVYPTREYGDLTFPSGTYRSLRVIIGDGEGQNWWCVLFPPLCLDIAKGSAPEDDSLAVGLTPGEHQIITGSADGGYRLKFKALELLEEIFSGGRK